VALYLVGQAAFRLRMAGRVEYPELIAAAACVVVFVATGSLVAWGTAGLITLVVGLLVAWEAGVQRSGLVSP
jgi:O-antigen ligase